MAIKNKGWEEKQQPIMTRKGVQDKAPRHYDVYLDIGEFKKEQEGTSAKQLSFEDLLKGG